MFLDMLGYNAADAKTNTKTKVLARYLKPIGAAPSPPDAGSSLTYVHSKIWIMDDRFAVIGSSNCNNRGYNHDSEVVAGIYDESQDTPLYHTLCSCAAHAVVGLAPADDCRRSVRSRQRFPLAESGSDIENCGVRSELRQGWYVQRVQLGCVANDQCGCCRSGG